MKRATKFTLFIIPLILLIALPSMADGKPGEHFEKLMGIVFDQPNLMGKIEAAAKYSEKPEADLIRLFGELVDQCVLPNVDGCSFQPKNQYPEWNELVLMIQDQMAHAMKDGQINWVGAGFKCAVEHLEGSTEQVYLDCLKTGPKAK